MRVLITGGRLASCAGRLEWVLVQVAPDICRINEKGADDAEVRADVEARRGIGDMSAAERMRRRSQARAALDSRELRGRGGLGRRR